MCLQRHSSGPRSWRRAFGRLTGGSAALAAALALLPASALAQGPLYSQGRTFTATDRFIGAHVFHWYSPENTTVPGWQADGAWEPLEGRQNWDGSVAFFYRQLKDMIDANLDVIYVALMDVPSIEDERVNLFRAYAQLRAEGYDPPKIAPFLDGYMTWAYPQAPQKTIDFATTAGKDTLVNHYKRFYNQYYQENTDVFADSYIAQISGRPIINNWHLIPFHGVQNPLSLSRADVESRLSAYYGAAHPIFNNGVYWINTATQHDKIQTWTDEIFHQFTIHHPPQRFHIANYPESGIPVKRTAMLKPGHWSENTDTPGINPPNFLPRAGGATYNSAWSDLFAVMNGTPRIYHAVIESWNEYTESTGLYEGDPGPPFLCCNNPGTNTDTWSSTNNPREYIDRTAARAWQFTGRPERDAKVLWSSVPSTVGPGQAFSVSVIVRNEGWDEWRGSKDYKLGVREPSGFGTPFAPSRILISDGADEIPRYGGIFRGKPKRFTFNLTAPTTPGTYQVRFQMVREAVAWFGQSLDKTITVQSAPPATASVNLGSTDVNNSMRRATPEHADGTTIAVTQGGVVCRRTSVLPEDKYIYFRVDDTFAFAGNRPTVQVKVDYFDNATPGFIRLEYDGASGPYTIGTQVNVTGSNTWKSFTWQLSDAYFANRQNASADFRILRSNDLFLFVDKVTLTAP